MLSKSFDDIHSLIDCKRTPEYFQNLSELLCVLKGEYDYCCEYLYRIIKVNLDNEVIKYSGYQEDVAVIFERLDRCLQESLRNRDELNVIAKQLEVLAKRYYELMPYDPNKNSIF